MASSMSRPISIARFSSFSSWGHTMSLCNPAKKYSKTCSSELGLAWATNNSNSWTLLLTLSTYRKVARLSYTVPRSFSPYCFIKALEKSSQDGFLALSRQYWNQWHALPSILMKATCSRSNDLARYTTKNFSTRASHPKG